MGSGIARGPRYERLELRARGRAPRGTPTCGIHAFRRALEVGAHRLRHVTQGQALRRGAGVAVFVADAQRDLGLGVVRVLHELELDGLHLLFDASRRRRHRARRAATWRACGALPAWTSACRARPRRARPRARRRSTCRARASTRGRPRRRRSASASVKSNTRRAQARRQGRGRGSWREHSSRRRLAQYGVTVALALPEHDGEVVGGHLDDVFEVNPRGVGLVVTVSRSRLPDEGRARGGFVEGGVARRECAAATVRTVEVEDAAAAAPSTVAAPSRSPRQAAQGAMSIMLMQDEDRRSRIDGPGRVASRHVERERRADAVGAEVCRPRVDARARLVVGVGGLPARDRESLGEIRRMLARAARDLEDVIAPAGRSA